MSRLTLTQLAADPDALTSGESTRPRVLVTSTSSTCAPLAGLNLVYFTARKTESISQIKTFSAATAAAGLTLAQLAVFSVAANGDLTLVASTPNDTTLWGTTYTAYTKSFSAAFTKLAGQRYAVGLQIAGTTLPTMVGVEHGAAGTTDTILAGAPRLVGQAANGSLPSSLANASISGSRRDFYAELLP